MSAHTHTHRSARISSRAHTHTYRERQNSLGFFGCASSARRFPLLRWQWVEESTPSLPPFALRRLQRNLLHIVVYFGFFWPLQFVVAADAAVFFFKFCAAAAVRTGVDCVGVCVRRQQLSWRRCSSGSMQRGW